MIKQWHLSYYHVSRWLFRTSKLSLIWLSWWCYVVKWFVKPHGKSFIFFRHAWNYFCLLCSTSLASGPLVFCLPLGGSERREERSTKIKERAQRTVQIWNAESSESCCCYRTIFYTANVSRHVGSHVALCELNKIDRRWRHPLPLE